MRRLSWRAGYAGLASVADQPMVVGLLGLHFPFARTDDETTALPVLLLASLPALASEDVLHVYNWNDYIAPETVERFEKFCAAARSSRAITRTTRS